jgi:aryl-alcohol dehydrogenase-like predicted oxidoreductase
MKERGNREDVVIIGKGGIRRSPPAPHKSMPAFIEADIWESLGYLQTDYMDLYLMHYDGPGHPVGPFVETLYRHLEAGRIHAYGGSNWTHERIEEANEYAAVHRMAPFVASEPNYSLAEQVILPTPDRITLQGAKYADARAWYAANQMPVFSYSSIGGGFMSGRVTRANYQEVLSPDRIRVYGHEVNLKRLDRAWELAEEKGVTVPQIALAFIVDSPLNVFPLVGARTGDEFADSVKSLDLHLSERERAWLDLESDTR